MCRALNCGRRGNRQLIEKEENNDSGRGLSKVQKNEE
jgi:hypothetical protein